MLIYFTCVFLILLFFLIRKNLKQQSTLCFLGITLSWILTLISVVLYISRITYFYNYMDNFLNIPPLIINNLIYMQVNNDVSIRLINIGIVSFIYFHFAFAYTFSGKQFITKNSKLFFFIISIVPIAELIFYDPLTLKYMDRVQNISISTTNPFIRNLDIIFKFSNTIYMISTFLILIIYYVKFPKIKFLNHYILYNIASLFSISTVHYIMFSWTPSILIRSTVLQDYYNYLTPIQGKFILVFKYSSILIFFLLAIMIIIIFRYSAMESYYNKQGMRIRIGIDTATMGIQAFTHSIKNHILVIRNETDHLKEMLKDNEEAISSLNVSLNACQNCLSSIDNAVSKFKNSYLVLNLTSIEVPIINALKEFHFTNTISIRYQGNDILPKAYLDENLMTDVIVNIIQNSIDAIGEKKDGQILISFDIQNNWGIIDIKDNGPGIPTDNIEKIFTPFFSTKTAITNWGIGLAFCHKIVTAHDGKIMVDSKVGKGTSFKIALPTI